MEAAPNRKYIDIRSLPSDFPAAHAALHRDNDEDEGDLAFYISAGELFCESHDEYVCFVWRNARWGDVRWEDRPSVDVSGPGQVGIDL